MQKIKRLQVRTEAVADEAIDELIRLAKPIIKWLYKNEELLGSVNITINGIFLTENILTVKMEQKDIDEIGENY